MKTNYNKMRFESEEELESYNNLSEKSMSINEPVNAEKNNEAVANFMDEHPEVRDDIISETEERDGETTLWDCYNIGAVNTEAQKEVDAELPIIEIVDCKKVNVRYAPTQQSGVMAIINVGEKLACLDRNEGWVKVIVNYQSGFIMEKYTK